MVGAVARHLREAGPGIVFKKVDSRLKGAVGAEARAIADVFGHGRLIVCPAIPDQQRFVREGCVVGRGVAAPIDAAAPFRGVGRPVAAADAASDTDLDALVRDADWRNALAVGARGLGAAFARTFSAERRLENVFVPHMKTLFGLGTRDPITLAQMDVLTESGVLATQVYAQDGAVPPGVEVRLPALARIAGDHRPGAADAIAASFGEGMAALVRQTRPRMLMLGGGDTALAVLAALDIGVVRPRGEIEPGVPWFDIAGGDGVSMACAVKSGGFGDRWTLLALVAPSDAAIARARVSGQG